MDLNFEPGDTAAKQFVKGSLDIIQKTECPGVMINERGWIIPTKDFEDTAKGLEDVLASFQTSLSQVETDPKKLARLIVC